MAARLIDCLATDAEFADLFSDEAVLGAMLRFEVALASAQARIGMIPERAADAIAEAAKAAEFDAAMLSRDARASATVVIPLVKSLTARVGAADPASAGFVHLGATSQDVIDTALVLLLREAKKRLGEHEARLARALRHLAEEYAGSVMPARTVLQPAPPTTFGYKAAAWFASVERTWRSVETAFEGALQLQFGGASGTLAAYGERGIELAAEMARELDLPPPPAPWQAHRDRLAALAAACGVFTGALCKIARDVSLLMQPEVGELSEAGGGSSAMPNKKNPAGSVLVMAAALRTPGLVASCLGAMVQENERAAGGWQTEWPVMAELIQATGSAVATLANTLASLEVNTERMRRNIESSVFAEKASMLLAKKVGRTEAQKVVREALAGGDLRVGLAKSALLTAEEIEAIDRPEDYLGNAETFRRRLLGAN